MSTKISIDTHYIMIFSLKTKKTGNQNTKETKTEADLHFNLNKIHVPCLICHPLLFVNWHAGISYAHSKKLMFENCSAVKYISNFYLRTNPSLFTKIIWILVKECYVIIEFLHFLVYLSMITLQIDF